MSDEQKSFPVRYMVVYAWFGWKVIDTCMYVGEEVCKTSSLPNAHRIAKLLNESEGYEYRP